MSDRDCWATPQHIFDVLHARYHFDMDVCATADNAKLPRYITPEMNALSVFTNWGKCNWCNPPYSRGSVRKWLYKAYGMTQHNAKTVMLLNYCFDRTYFDFFRDKCRIVLISPRIEFIPPPGIPNENGNNQGQMLAIFGIDEKARWWDWNKNVWDGDPKRAELFEEGEKS